MAVWKRGKSWMFEFRHQGARHFQGGFRKKRDAQKAEIKRREILKRPPKDMDLLTLCTKRLEWLEQNRTPKYFYESQKIIKKFLAFAGDVMVSQITRDDIEYFLSTIQAAYFSNYHLRIIRALFNHGVEREWFDRNPTKGIKFHSVEKKKKYIPPKEDIDKVIELAGEDKVFFITLKNTLARVSEIYRLKWEDVNLTDRTITLYTRKKRGGHYTPRTIPMTNELYNALKGLELSGEYVFINPDTSTRYVDKKKALIALCELAGIKRFTFHAIRHYGASTLAKKNVPLPDIQAILGHESLTTTALYIQSLVGHTSKSIHSLE